MEIGVQNGLCTFAVGHEERLLIGQPECIVRRTNRGENHVPGIVIIVHVLDGHHPVLSKDRGIKVVYRSVGIEIAFRLGGRFFSPAVSRQQRHVRIVHPVVV